MPKSILIVEDETDLADLLSFNLKREGYLCRHAPDGSSALSEVNRSAPDLILLDRMLPGMPGDEVAAELKRSTTTSKIPIMMLTAKAEELDQLVGFAVGADDYITKPFSIKVLIARIRAILRRSEAPDTDDLRYEAGPIRLDPSRHEVRVDDQVISFTATEFRLLKVLISAHGRVLDRARLVEVVLGPDAAVTDRTIDVHVAAVRRKLGAAAGWLQTVRGVGYRVQEPG